MTLTTMELRPDAKRTCDRVVDFADWVKCHSGCKIGRLGVRLRPAHILQVPGVNGDQQKKKAGVAHLDDAVLPRQARTG